MKRSFDSRTSESPGIISPAFRMTISPAQSLRQDFYEVPSRSTAALIWTMESSFSTAFEAPRSCQNPSKPLMRTMERMIKRQPDRAEKMITCAKIRIRIIGLLNWDTSRVKTFERFGVLGD